MIFPLVAPVFSTWSTDTVSDNLGQNTMINALHPSTASLGKEFTDNNEVSMFGRLGSVGGGGHVQICLSSGRVSGFYFNCTYTVLKVYTEH